MARGLLISYPGCPYTPSSLLPDNRLANLAGALIEAGHEVLVPFPVSPTFAVSG
jgi:hypothetical protein